MSKTILYLIVMHKSALKDHLTIFSFCSLSSHGKLETPHYTLHNAMLF